MASRGLVKCLSVKNWNLVSTSLSGKFYFRAQQKCSDCGQLLGAAVILARSKTYPSENQGKDNLTCIS